MKIQSRTFPRSHSLRRLAVVLAVGLAGSACVPKKDFVAKQAEVDSCFKALEEENRKKKELAAATAHLQAKLAELTSAYEAAEGLTAEKQAELAKLKAELDKSSAEISRLQTEKEELAKKSQTYDQLVSSLQKEIDEGKIKIKEAKNRLSVELIDKILFDSGSTIIQPEGLEALKKVATILRGVSDKQILVEGHTDAVAITGKLTERFPTNWELSVARATTVVRFLEDQGVDPKVLGAAGFSKFRPVATNDTDAGKSLNRRIEIVLTPRIETVASN